MTAQVEGTWMVHQYAGMERGERGNFRHLISEKPIAILHTEADCVKLLNQLTEECEINRKPTGFLWRVPGNKRAVLTQHGMTGRVRSSLVTIGWA